MPGKNPLLFVLLATCCSMFAFIGCDSSTGPTQSTKTIELVAPKGGESYKVGQTVTISWKINDATKVSSVGIKLSTDNGKSYTMLVDHSISPETTSFSWTVISEQVSEQCILSVYEYIDNSINDKSTAFTVTN